MSLSDPSLPLPASLPRKSRRYSRPVSGLERYSLVLHGAYRYHVDGIIEGVGDIDAQSLRSAIALAAAANPAIRVRLRGWLGWSRWVDSGRAPELQVLPLTDWDGSSEAGASFLETKLNPRHAVADVLLVPCRDGRTRLVFRSLHAAIDGRGCIHWMSEVCRALRGEALQGSDSELTDQQVQQSYADRIPEEPATPQQQCIPVLEPAPFEQRQTLSYVWRRVLIDRDVPQLLTKAAVFLAEWARRREAGEVGFTIPVDYRGFRIQEMGIGNLTGYLRLKVPEGASSRSLVAQLGQRIKAYADCRQFPGLNTLRWLPVWLMLRQLRPQIDKVLYTVTPALPTGGVVSMGSLKVELFHFPGFVAERAYGVPGSVGKLNFIFVNYPDHVCAIFAAPAAYNHRGQLDELVAAFQQHFSSSSTLAGPVS